MSLSEFNPNQREILEISFQLIQEKENLEKIRKDRKNKIMKILKDEDEVDLSKITKNEDKNQKIEETQDETNIDSTLNDLVNYFFVLKTEQTGKKIKIMSMDDSNFENQDEHEEFLRYRKRYSFLMFFYVVISFLAMYSIYLKRVKPKKLKPVEKFSSSMNY